MFSKRSITKFEPIVHEKVELLSQGIAAYEGSDRVLSLNSAFNAFAGDVIASYCFGFSYDQLKSPDFHDNFHSAYEGVRRFSHFGLQFPSVFIMFVLQKDLQGKITNIINGHEKSQLDSEHPTIFNELLRSNLPPPEKSVRRLGSEAQQMIGAGVETVAWALTTTVFYLLNNPSSLNRLRIELEEAIPDPAKLPDSLILEKLPYLAACAKEGVRLSTGVSVRLPRVSPNKPIKYRDWVIPPGTPVSMTTLDVLRDQQVFPDSASFVPERWLDNPKTKDGDSINRYFVPFGKGPRMCIGIK
ncbi:hypothetical protein SLS62_001999 [Diatrype stigma]|uniref:Cytochrome P450 n=1 Tax=Diatrype stigma TaxID=117547 RepID=A0AAN9UY48_9PEZI